METQVQIVNDDLDANWLERRDLSSQQSKLLSQLQVEVGIEVGVSTLSADQLIDWVAGDRLSFALHPQDSVVMTIGGEKIARAHLVREGEEVFLEIAEIYLETEDESCR